MAPTKVQMTSKQIKFNTILPRHSISTRASQMNAAVDSQNVMPPPAVGKRKADASPKNENLKRSALGNVTNAVLNTIDDDKKGDKINVAQRTRDAAAIVAAKTATQTNAKTNANVNVNCNQTNAKTKTSATAIDSILLPMNFVGTAQTKIMTRAALRATQPARTLGVNVEKTVKLLAAAADAAITTVSKEKKNNAKIAAEANKKTDSTMNSNNTDTNGSLTCINSSSNCNDKIEVPKLQNRRNSNDSDLNDHDGSLYVSALEDLATTPSISSPESIHVDERKMSIRINVAASNVSGRTIFDESVSRLSPQKVLSEEATLNVMHPAPVPDGIVDFDRENWNDPFQASHYAMDIFNYLKEREQVFRIDSYMQQQPHLTPWMRTLLVDWMVEVQETFELNHETLYLAVKIVDIYLSKVPIRKEKLQLLGAAALLMSCKYDERMPPMIDDFLYICDGAYSQVELTQMEINMFRTIGFDLGIPLSYRFLRRYARCAKVTMPELTLARFILEYSLMNFDLITMSDSKIASACLFMALRMSNKTGWNKTLEYYSGYKLTDFESIVPMLNAALHQKQRDANKTIRNKYSHKVFFEVSKIPLMSDEKLFEPSAELMESGHC